MVGLLLARVPGDPGFFEEDVILVLQKHLQILEVVFLFKDQVQWRKKSYEGCTVVATHLDLFCFSQTGKV